MRLLLLLLVALIATLASLPTTHALYRWMPKRQLYNVGPAKAVKGKPYTARTWAGRCNGGDIPNGGYGCADFRSVGKTIYRCENGWLKWYEQCKYNSHEGGDCSRNQLKPSKKKWYPIAVPADKAVCMYFGKFY